MLSSKPKSGLSDASINKGPPSTPRTSKLGRAGSTKQDPDSPSPQQVGRPSIDRSPRSAESTPAINRRSPKISTPDRQPKNLKGSDLQAQLVAVQEELIKAKDRLVLVEKEKAVIAEELRGAKAAADEANEKLQDALVSQRIAEEASEIDKFRADELEQAGFEATQKREEEWWKELQNVRDQHAVDIAALLTATQELQRVQHELAMTTEAKNTALSHADDAMKIAEINADKVELLSGEINRLKALLDLSVQSKSAEDSDAVKKTLDLEGQLSVVQEDLKKANEKLTSMEKEKIQALEELKDAQKLAEEANEKLKENLDSHKKAEEAAEMYRIRASDLEKEKINALEELHNARKLAEEANEKHKENLDSCKKAEESAEMNRIHASDLEKEKINALEELHDARKLAEEASVKLKETLDAHKKAEEVAEVYKLRASELEKEKIHALEELQYAKKSAEEANEKLKVNLDEHKKTEEAAEMYKLHASELEKEKIHALEELQHAKKLAEEANEKLSENLNELKKTEEAAEMYRLHASELEKEKIRTLEDLNNTKKLVDEANEKLKKNLDEYKKAVEAAEMYKIRASELEQENTKTAQKKEEDWQKKLENLKEQHAADIAAFLSTKEELEQLKHELAMAVEAKNEALSNADDAMNIAEVNSEKVKFLTEDVNRLKVLLDSKQELEGEIAALRDSLDKAKEDGKKLVEMEELLGGLKDEVSDAKKAESELSWQLEEWKKKTQFLEGQLEETNQSYESTRNSLASVTKQLEESNGLLQDKECEVAALSGKVQSLEVEISSHKAAIDESHKVLEEAQLELLQMGKTIEGLKVELQNLKEEKMQALDKEKVAASSIVSLTEEKNKLMIELQAAQGDAENNKEGMDRLASALHEVSTEAREAQERFLVKQTEVESAHEQIEVLELKLEQTKDNYEVMLEESRKERSSLQVTLERFEMEVEKLKGDWISKELDFASTIRRSEEELATIKGDMDGIIESLKAAELRLQVAKEEEVQRLSKLKDLECKVAIARKDAEEAKVESLQLKDLLLDKENELQSIVQENDDVKVREADALNRVKELSSLLAEAMAKNCTEVSEPSMAERSSDMANPAASSLANVHSDADLATQKSKEVQVKADENDDVKENNDLNLQEEEQLELENKIGENGKVIDKDWSVEREHDSESVDDEVESTKLDGSNFDQTNETGLDRTNGSGFDQTNGLTPENISNGTNSPTKQQHQQKKKKGFVQKVGSLLKKKSNHK